MVPLRLFASRGFALTNLISLVMAFGRFGAVFLLAQFLQTVQHYTPLEAGVRTLPWTAMPVLAAPVAGVLTDRIGGRRVVALGLALQAGGGGRGPPGPPPRRADPALLLAVRPGR